jgi:hypothetical protein
MNKRGCSMNRGIVFGGIALIVAIVSTIHLLISRYK